MPSVLITGANRGLGLEFARQYLADGWQVYAACRDPASASELRQLAEDSGGRLQILAIDVTDPGSVKAAAAELEGRAIDLLLNNSGIIGPHGQTIGNIDYDAWAGCSKSTLWDPCGYRRPLSSMWHVASESLSLPSPAAWDLLPTIPLAARLLIAARRPR